MTKLLKDMCLNLSDSLKRGVSTVEKVQSYQKQLLFYRQMYEEAADKEKKEAALVAARCLISISRSLCENEHSGVSLDFARDELSGIKSAFEGSKTPDRDELFKIANKRIARLSEMGENELSDSFLFLYMSLLQL